MKSSELTSGFDFWSRGHIRMVAYSAPPDPLAGFGGATSKERGGEERGGEGKRGEGKGGERAMSPPLFGGSLRLCMQL